MLAFYMTMIDTPEERSDFETLYRTYKGKLFSVAYGVLGDHHDSEDAVSQAFLTIARNFTKIRQLDKQQREAYLRIVIRNAAIDIYRRRKKDSSIALEDIAEMGGEVSAGMSEDVSDEVLSEMNYSSIVEAIRSLPDKDAEPLYLFHVRELSIREIAAALCEQEETVKKRLQRARKKLRSVLEKNGVTL